MDNIQIKRSLAFLIDVFVVSIIIPFFKGIFLMSIPIHSFEISGIHFTWGITLTPVFYGLYFVIFDVVKNGQTFGKLILGIHTISKNKEKLRIKKRLLRSVCKILSMLLLPVSIMLFLFKNHYTIQDHYANTITIKKKKQP